MVEGARVHEGPTAGGEPTALVAAEILTECAREITAVSSVEDTLAAIVSSAARSLPDIDHAGITTAYADGRLVTRASSDQVAHCLDELQREVGQGPCVFAAKAETVVRVESARHEQRWPLFIQPALRKGLRSVLSVRLNHDPREMSALNLYSDTRDQLDHELEDLAEVFAAYASLALGRARREEQLTSALVTRRVIGQATGIIMARHKIGEDGAFAYLTRLSNHANVKLRDVAQSIVDEANQNGGRAH